MVTSAPPRKSIIIKAANRSRADAIARGAQAMGGRTVKALILMLVVNRNLLPPDAFILGRRKTNERSNILHPKVAFFCALRLPAVESFQNLIRHSNRTIIAMILAWNQHRRT